ncbi:BTB/POZ domain-containing protein kctd15-like [Asterias amurensis]|uniref:BTB/POZ domain-containing protein kctd15-like n=1 Tax=Asterias amurensis TaxID=7602 RepID=UPI003AB59095
MATKMITLNVGGTIYTTSIETLTRYPDSMLGTMFKTQHEDSGTRLDPSNKDEHGRFVIDWDGPMFRFVLNFLRESSLTLPEDFKEMGLLRREAGFYQIKPLIKAVDKLVDEAVDMIEPKSSSQLEWVKVVQSKAGGSLTMFGKQEIHDQIKEQQTKNYCFNLNRLPLLFNPCDSIAVTRFDVLLESVLRNNAQQPTYLPDAIEFWLRPLGFVKFSESCDKGSQYYICVRRTYPDK